ncbi:acetyl-CoA carboxylase carboxyltransferase component [Pseudoglutamicibacter albus]|uniref:Acetyl-CoA carboxylase carboxyltransferase component n=1 Tax=Pseudoglutamicibacter albus TaxID=98671 RepID=A0ABU1YWW7_9MICC|nr:acyl-CoA carboxylase subunit beta [Pseudoglutamicibacter albus]MDR7292847.1 acetyl-CoA carboxylase carboxyltransferase component [Pseudoglutamicibacter albus]
MAQSIETDETTVHDRLKTSVAEAKLGGSEKNRQKIKDTGKLLVRERLAELFDDENYIEDGLLARFEDGLPGDAVVIAFGKVDGREVCVIANDYSVKAGTWGNRTFEKITMAQKKAEAAGIPIVYLFDSAGARIDEQFESFAGRNAWGNIFYNQVQISGRVPQVCALFGPSPAGSAYVPALCDLTIMVRGNATAYLGSPRLAEMVTGEKVTLEEMGGAEMHSTVSGLGDVLVDDDSEAVAAIRVWLSFLPPNWTTTPPIAEAVPPREGRSIEEIVPLREAEVFDMEELVESLVDEGTWFPYKELFAPEMITGFARINGRPVGLVGNQPTHMGGSIFPNSSDKAARFIWICNAYGIPIIFLVDIAGYMIGSEVERQGIIRHGAKMIFAVSECRVPRITVLVRKAYGGGYLAMSGSPMNPDAVIALPTARPALMGPDAAVNGIYYNQIHAIEDPQARKAFIAEKHAEYAEKIDVFKIANANAVEAVVPANDLRDDLTRRLALYSKRDTVPVERRQAVTPV